MSGRVTIARYYAAHEAHLAQMQLESHGIEAFVLGATGEALMQLYDSAPRVALEVRAADADAARNVLAHRAIDEAGGSPYRDVEHVDHHDEFAPAAPEVAASWEHEVRADEGAARAFRGAVLGFFFCPGLFHLYVLWQLRALDTSALSPRGRRSLRWARILSVATLGGIALLAGVRYAEARHERAESERARAAAAKAFASCVEACASRRSETSLFLNAPKPRACSDECSFSSKSLVDVSAVDGR